MRFQRGPRAEVELAGASLAGSAHGGKGAWVANILAGFAFLFSAYSLWATELRRPQLTAHVPQVIQYSDPSNDSFEVFNVPVTISNVGARQATVLAMELTVSNTKGERKRFYAADTGRWTMTAARAGAFTPFMPMAVPGKSAVSAPLLFYPVKGETIESIIDQAGGTYRFELQLGTADDESYGVLDDLLRRPSEPRVFEMEIGSLDHRNFTEGTMAMTSTSLRSQAAKSP